MLWLIPTVLIACLSTFFLGYYYKSMVLKIQELETIVKTIPAKKPEPEEPNSQLIDPDDEIQNAIAEHARMMKKLNPNG